MTPYMAVYFDFGPESIFNPFYISTLVGDLLWLEKSIGVLWFYLSKGDIGEFGRV